MNILPPFSELPPLVVPVAAIDPFYPVYSDLPPLVTDGFVPCYPVDQTFSPFVRGFVDPCTMNAAYNFNELGQFGQMQTCTPFFQPGVAPCENDYTEGGWPQRESIEADVDLTIMVGNTEDNTRFNSEASRTQDGGIDFVIRDLPPNAEIQAQVIHLQPEDSNGVSDEVSVFIKTEQELEGVVTTSIDFITVEQPDSASPQVSVLHLAWSDDQNKPAGTGAGQETADEFAARIRLSSNVLPFDTEIVIPATDKSEAVLAESKGAEQEQCLRKEVHQAPPEQIGTLVVFPEAGPLIAVSEAITPCDSVIPIEGAKRLLAHTTTAKPSVQSPLDEVKRHAEEIPKLIELVPEPLHLLEGAPISTEEAIRLTTHAAASEVPVILQEVQFRAEGMPPAISAPEPLLSIEGDGSAAPEGSKTSEFKPQVVKTLVQANLSKAAANHPHAAAALKAESKSTGKTLASTKAERSEPAHESASELKEDAKILKKKAKQIKEEAEHLEEERKKLKGEVKSLKEEAQEKKWFAKELKQEAKAGHPELMVEVKTLKHEIAELKDEALELKQEAKGLHVEAKEQKELAKELKGDARDLKREAKEVKKASKPPGPHQHAF